MSKRNVLAVGFTLFALFFGAGNLIFPAQLGQYAGTNFWFAAIGFLVTGVGLPLLGILAMAYSGSQDLQGLASKVHPIYGLFFTILLYMTIGPFFATPRTATVAFEVGIDPFVSSDNEGIALLIFSVIFFGVVLLFSLFPAKMVDNIGKILAPILFVLLGILLIAGFLIPMGTIQSPIEGYETSVAASINGFLEGYNTMDALASLVFGILIIQIVRQLGISKRKDIFKYTLIPGLLAVLLLGVIYIGIMYLGGTSVSTIGMVDNGGPILNSAAEYYFGVWGGVLLAIVIILACLTTAIGLTIATAEYLYKLIPVIPNRGWVIIFTLIPLIIANFGLDNIITFSLPMLMFLYPLAITLVLLTFIGPLFQHARMVYVMTMAVTFLIAIVDGLKELFASLEMFNPTWLQMIIDAYHQYLPFYEEGLGWLIPVVVVVLLATLLYNIFWKKQANA